MQLLIHHTPHLQLSVPAFGSLPSHNQVAGFILIKSYFKIKGSTLAKIELENVGVKLFGKVLKIIPWDSEAVMSFLWSINYHQGSESHRLQNMKLGLIDNFAQYQTLPLTPTYTQRQTLRRHRRLSGLVMKDKSLQEKCLKYRDSWYFLRAHSRATCEHRSTELSVVPKRSSQPVSYHTSPCPLLGTNGSTLGSCPSNLTKSPCVYMCLCLRVGVVGGGQNNLQIPKPRPCPWKMPSFGKQAKTHVTSLILQIYWRPSDVNWIRSPSDICSYWVISYLLIFF